MLYPATCLANLSYVTHRYILRLRLRLLLLSFRFRISPPAQDGELGALHAELEPSVPIPKEIPLLPTCDNQSLYPAACAQDGELGAPRADLERLAARESEYANLNWIRYELDTLRLISDQVRYVHQVCIALRMWSRNQVPMHVRCVPGSYVVRDHVRIAVCVRCEGTSGVKVHQQQGAYVCLERPGGVALAAPVCSPVAHASR